MQRLRTKMTTPPKPEELEELWRHALRDYRQEGLRERLSNEWPDDPNVEALAYGYPPTFQPGYVGRHYFASGVKVVLIGQNPGEGRDPVSVAMDREYRDALEAFMEGETGFEDLNRLIADHMLKWRVFQAKGIFRESGAARISLLDEDVRPSIKDVAYVNYFPFKVTTNDPPLNSHLQRCVWKTYLVRFLGLLAPSLIVAMGVGWYRSAEVQLRTVAGSASVIAVWNPSDRLVNTRPAELLASWGSLSARLRELR
jgi:hypothetical protein